MLTAVHSLGELENIEFTVIFAQYQGQWLYARHKERRTWETAGGHVEDGETVLCAAKRELYEETGAAGFVLSPAFDYSVRKDSGVSCGRTFFARVERLAPLPESEMCEVKLFDALPEEMTYPQILPVLYDKLQAWLAGMRTAMPAAERFMRSRMTDSAHDVEHIYRVLNYALDIARHEGGADRETLTAACLLHDIARDEQFADSGVDHAMRGGDLAYDWLTASGYTDAFANAVRSCIQTHSYRSDNPPRSLEAKILFDADKLEVCGAVGIARTLFYQAHTGQPLYSLDEHGGVLDGSGDLHHSFCKEYKFKLEKLYDKFYTERGAALAKKRRQAARGFYDALLEETRECFRLG